MPSQPFWASFTARSGCLKASMPSSRWTWVVSRRRLLVSDVWRGPGWWLASDDKWYPPELHPDASVVPVGASQKATFQQVQGAARADQMAAVRAGTAQGMPASTSATMSDLTDFSVGAVTAKSVGARERKRGSFLPALAALCVVISGATAYVLLQGSNANAVAGASPNQAAALATAAARDAGSVHVVSSIRIQGQIATYVNDTGSDSGKQVITAGGAQVTAIVVGGAAYVNANQLAMSEMFQSSPAASHEFAGKWLSFPSSAQAYARISSTLTLSSLLQAITPMGPPTKLSPSTVNGQSVIGIRGDLPNGGSGTLFISSTGVPLPVEEVSGPSGGETTTVFGGWGDPVRPTAPSEAIPGSETGLF